MESHRIALGLQWVCLEFKAGVHCNRDTIVLHELQANSNALELNCNVATSDWYKLAIDVASKYNRMTMPLRRFAFGLHRAAIAAHWPEIGLLRIAIALFSD
jgi:hypothetical protein